MTNKETGNKGEEIAADYLKNLGYEIIDRNRHFSKSCEIDIIAKDKDTTVFVEVKTRKTTNYGHPFEAINKQKMEKIYQGVLIYCTENKIKQYRIDGIAVIGTVSPQIEHLKNLGFD